MSKIKKVKTMEEWDTLKKKTMESLSKITMATNDVINMGASLEIPSDLDLDNTVIVAQQLTKLINIKKMLKEILNNPAYDMIFEGEEPKEETPE